jgi:hypothetical protein
VGGFGEVKVDASGPGRASRTVKKQPGPPHEHRPTLSLSLGLTSLSIYHEHPGFAVAHIIHHALVRSIRPLTLHSQPSPLHHVHSPS